MFDFTLVLTTFVFLVAGANELRNDQCTTPNNEKAKCQSLYTCLVLLQALITQKNEALNFVRESHCGTWSNETQPLVCCGTKASKVVEDNPKKSEGTRPSVARKPISDKRFCGYQHTDDYFYTGNVTAIDEFPWLAVLKYKRDADLDGNLNDGFVELGCSGSLINKRYVLTAAQCLRLRTSSAVAVRLGEYNIQHDMDCVKFSELDECSNPVEDVGIEKIIKHPQYNRRLGLNDMALLRLNRNIPFTDYIRPICLPDAQTKFAKVGDTMTLSGFGRIDADDKYAIIKKKILSRLISNEQCHKEFTLIDSSAHRRVTNNIMCTKKLEVSNDRPCEGDSGGPLMFSYRTQWHIEGIAVWSTNICDSAHPFAYTKVINYMDWIESTVVP